MNHVEYTLGLTRFNFNDFGAYEAASLSVRDRLIEAWNDTNEYFTVSRIYILKYILNVISFMIFMNE